MISVVTTFNNQGFIDYGYNFIKSFSKNVDKEIPLYVYAEDCRPEINDPRVYVLCSHEVNHELTSFKNKWKDVPKANGTCPFPENRPKDFHKSFKWDAVRFSNKVYSVLHASETINTDILVWMDADSVVHSPISYEQFHNLVDPKYWIHYLGRRNKWPECGFYGLNLNQAPTKLFLKELRRYYNYAETGIFTLPEWHDSYVFGHILKKVKKIYPKYKIKDFSGHIVKGEGHPLINSELGAFFDHLKGDRKKAGKSRKEDLIVKRTEAYWKSL